MSLHKQIVATWERVLAKDYVHWLASQHEPASAYQANWQVKEAMKMLKQVATIRGRVLAEDRRHRFASEHILLTLCPAIAV